ncbi:helix-turn-helix domain-containing protein [Neorhizobium lilium]|uniref:helix-turn-helix domain-containing protein n=1 Tax=Neorhizobium lilium TaxID=2503024 RepID=UPI003CCB2E31
MKRSIATGYSLLTPTRHCLPRENIGHRHVQNRTCRWHAVRLQQALMISPTGRTENSRHSFRAFLTVVETGSVTEAAELCFVLQPAVTQALAKIGADGRRSALLAHAAADFCQPGRGDFGTPDRARFCLA